MKYICFALVAFSFSNLCYNLQTAPFLAAVCGFATFLETLVVLDKVLEEHSK